MDFDAEFNQVAKQMQLDFERARRLSRHPGIKGDVSETIVKSFLADYLPQNLQISSGQIFDTNGKVSRQLDIIIHDRDNTPVLYLDRDMRNCQPLTFCSTLSILFAPKNELCLSRAA